MMLSVVSLFISTFGGAQIQAESGNWTLGELLPHCCGDATGSTAQLEMGLGGWGGGGGNPTAC